MLKPPEDQDPADVFELLLQTPRPVIPLAYRLRCAERYELSAQAVTSAEMRRVWGSGDFALALTVASLRANGVRAFRSVEAMCGALDEQETKELGHAVQHALLRIPVLGISEPKAWRAYLQTGAVAHIHTAHVLGSCVDPFTGNSRPDHFFGLPMNQLLCCHWFAFWAARSVFQEHPK